MATITDSELDILEKDFPRYLHQLRKYLKDRSGIVIPKECDDFVKRCLRLKDYNLEKAAKLVKQFHAVMKDFKNWDARLEPSAYEEQYLNGICRAMPQKDSLGRRIFVIKPAVWNPAEVNFDKALTIQWLAGQYSSYEFVDSQRKGIIVIWDFSGFDKQHAWNVKVRRLVNLALWVQNGLVARIKEIHMIFHSRLVYLVYSAVTPFLKEKLKERVIFHGDDVSSLHKHVEPHLLPGKLGGRGNCDEAFYDKAFQQGLLEQDAFFSEWKRMGFPKK